MGIKLNPALSVQPSSNGLPLSKESTWQWLDGDRTNQTFTRNIATKAPETGEAVSANEPRPVLARPYASRVAWEPSAFLDLSAFGVPDYYGSHFDFDNVNQLHVIWSPSASRLFVRRGDDLTSVTSQVFTNGDLMDGSIADTEYYPRAIETFHGCMVALCERRESGSANGVSILGSNDYGATWEVIHDVPAIAGGVADGLQRGRVWCVCVDPVTEGSKTEFWFTWADYLFKSGFPKGGQIGIAKCTRESESATSWTFEGGRLLHERWEVNDNSPGGLHYHCACVKSGGVLFAAGDVDYRNHFGFLEFDLNDWMTSTVTYSEIHGGWSEDDRDQNPSPQPVAFRPGKVFGTHVAAGDETGNVITLLGDMDGFKDYLTIKNLVFELKNSYSGVIREGYANLRNWKTGHGYTSCIDGVRLFSRDGESWASFNTLDGAGAYDFWIGKNHLFGIDTGGLIYRGNVPTVELVPGIELRPGGTNEALTRPVVQTAPAGGGSQEFVYWDGSDYRYVTGDELAPENDELKAAYKPFGTNFDLLRVTPGTSEDIGRLYLTDSTASVDFANRFFSRCFLFIPKTTRAGLGYTSRPGGVTGGGNANPQEKGISFHETGTWRPLNIRYDGTVNSGIRRVWNNHNSATLGNSEGQTFYCAFPSVCGDSNGDLYHLESGETGPYELCELPNVPSDSEFLIHATLSCPEDFWFPVPATPFITFYEDDNNYVSFTHTATTIEVELVMLGISVHTASLDVVWTCNQFIEVAVTKDSLNNLTMFVATDRSSIESTSFMDNFQPVSIRLGNFDQSDVRAVQLRGAKYVPSHKSESEFETYLQTPLKSR